MSVIELKNITKSFMDGMQKREILHDLNLTVNKGEFVAIVGPSGSGKSTLLRTINRMIDIDAGTILFNDVQIEKLKGKEIKNNEKNNKVHIRNTNGSTRL